MTTTKFKIHANNCYTITVQLRHAVILFCTLLNYDDMTIGRDVQAEDE